MKKLFSGIALLFLLCAPALAHRLDEYLQATIFSIAPGSVRATMRLVPGVAVAPAIIATIDRNRDGILSDDEQRAYAERVLADLQLKEDGDTLPLHLVAATFPSIAAMTAGTGEIELSFSATMLTAPGTHRLTFENHHQPAISVYLVNSLVPDDTRLQLGTQTRNQNQSTYAIIFTENTAAIPAKQSHSLSGFGAAFRLGVRHIAEGTDHLLFLLTLLLPAPLLAVAHRWAARATIRQSLLHILGIVTAFTLGHSLTLALSVFGVVHLPSRPVEVLIAVSILVSAIHAMRPIFPGREAFIAAAFGLIHGLAFASALNELGVTGWYRLVSLLGFNLGIESMQLAVVAIALPALLLLSRTSAYTAFRIAGAIVAAIASSAWIVERILDRANPIADAVERLAHHGVLLSVALWISSALAWAMQRRRLSSKVVAAM